MQNVFTMLGLAFALCLFPYAIAVVMPSWRWLAACTIIVGGALATVWIQEYLARQSPDFKEGIGYAIGFGFFFLLTAGFAGGVLVRAISLTAGALGWSFKSVLTTNIAGFFVLLIVLAAPVAGDEWRRRPLAEACVNSNFDVTIADAHLHMPALRFFNIYLGRTSARDAYYFSLDPSLRDFCSKTQNGKRPVRAVNLGFDLFSVHDIRKMTCNGGSPASQTALCTVLPTAHNGRYQLDIPVRAYVFAPNEVNAGEFGATPSTYEDSLTGRVRFAHPQFFRSDQKSPDDKPLTFVCEENSDGYYCRASYAWIAGAHLDYEFKSAKDAIIERGLKVDAATREFFSAFLAAQ